MAGGHSVICRHTKGSSMEYSPSKTNFQKPSKLLCAQIKVPLGPVENTDFPSTWTARKRKKEE